MAQNCPKLLVPCTSPPLLFRLSLGHVSPCDPGSRWKAWPIRCWLASRETTAFQRPLRSSFLEPSSGPLSDRPRANQGPPSEGRSWAHEMRVCTGPHPRHLPVLSASLTARRRGPHGEGSAQKVSKGQQHRSVDWDSNRGQHIQAEMMWGRPNSV